MQIQVCALVCSLLPPSDYMHSNAIKMTCLPSVDHGGLTCNTKHFCKSLSITASAECLKCKCITVWNGNLGLKCKNNKTVKMGNSSRS